MTYGVSLSFDLLRKIGEVNPSLSPAKVREVRKLTDVKNILLVSTISAHLFQKRKILTGYGSPN